MLKGLSFLILLSVCVIAHGQAPLREGEVFLINGDTLRGYIHDEEWLRAPTSLRYRADKTGDVREISASEIKGFWTSRPSRYETHTVSYDNDNQSRDPLPRKREPENIKEATTLLEVLVRSRYSLLYFLDENERPHYFYQNEGETPVELLNREVLRVVDGKESVLLYEKWKQQMANLQPNCEGLKEKLVASQYKEKSLVLAFQDLNACAGSTMETIADKSAVERRSRFGFIMQAFQNHTDAGIARTSFNEVNFGGGISYEIFSKRRPGRMSVYNEVKYRVVDQQGAYYTGIDVDMTLPSIRLINMLRSYYPKRNTTLFWNIGISTGYRMPPTIQHEGKDLSDNALGEYGTGIEAGFALGFGTQMKVRTLSTSIEARYELEAGPFDRSSFIGAHNLGIVLGVQF